MTCVTDHTEQANVRGRQGAQRHPTKGECVEKSACDLVFHCPLLVSELLKTK